MIASLNGHTPGGWLDYAAKMEEAGADALELNLYFLATDAAEPAGVLEARTLAVLRADYFDRDGNRTLNWSAC